MIPANQSIFLVYPKGYEERCTAIIAVDETDARRKAGMNKSLTEAQGFGADLIIRNLSEVFGKQGYNIYR